MAVEEHHEGDDDEAPEVAEDDSSRLGDGPVAVRSFDSCGLRGGAEHRCFWPEHKIKHHHERSLRRRRWQLCSVRFQSFRAVWCNEGRRSLGSGRSSQRPRAAGTRHRSQRRGTHQRLDGATRTCRCGEDKKRYFEFDPVNSGLTRFNVSKPARPLLLFK